MDIDQLVTFLAVVEERSFSRAALRLHRTQPAVSQVIRRLEQEVGELLFERSARDGSLTAAGQLLEDYARRLSGLRNEALGALAQLRSLERGLLLMAANEYTCLYLLSILDPFRRKFPRIEVSVQRSLASRIPEELSRRSMELGILSYRPDPARFRSQVVYVDRLVLVVNPEHRLAGQRRVSIRRLGSESFIAHKVPSPLRRQVYQAFEQHRTRLHSPVELPSLESVKRLVAMGNGVALVPGLTVERELERGELVGVEVPELEFTRNLRLVYRREAPLSHAAEAFLRTVRAVARERGSPFLYQGERDA